MEYPPGSGSQEYSTRGDQAVSQGVDKLCDRGESMRISESGLASCFPPVGQVAKTDDCLDQEPTHRRAMLKTCGSAPGGTRRAYLPD